VDHLTTTEKTPIEDWVRAQINAHAADAATRLYNRRREMLAQCEAYEKLLRPHNIVYDEEFGFYCNGCGIGIERPRARDDLDRCEVWRGVALAFQHRPGYREEWRP